jgi:hypothetical protein
VEKERKRRRKEEKGGGEGRRRRKGKRRKWKGAFPFFIKNLDGPLAQHRFFLFYKKWIGPPRTGGEDGNTLRKPRPASGLYGVAANKKRWQAQIYYNSKNYHLGTFDTKQEAALTYDRAARQCGEEKPLNYESIAAAEEAAAQAHTAHLLAHPPQQKPRPPSGFHCVYAIGNRWQAQIYYDKKRHSLGTFDTKQEAALAYDKAARQREEAKPLNYESIAAAEEVAAQAHAEHIHAHPPQPKPRPPSGFYGVAANRNRWIAQIYYDSKKHRLGSFDTKQEAALAYDKKARQCGKHNLLNYESIKAAEAAAARAQSEHRYE